MSNFSNMFLLLFCLEFMFINTPCTGQQTGQGQYDVQTENYVCPVCCVETNELILNKLLALREEMRRTNDVMMTSMQNLTLEFDSLSNKTDERLHFRGPPGYTGSTGQTGAGGVTGPLGSEGPPGPTGVIGLHGGPGLTGDAGNTGATGMIGRPGLVGDTGSTGNTGDTGSTGSTGRQGATGDVGFTGIIGPMGFTGPVGPHGSLVRRRKDAKVNAPPRRRRDTEVNAPLGDLLQERSTLRLDFKKAVDVKGPLEGKRQTRSTTSSNVDTDENNFNFDLRTQMSCQSCVSDFHDAIKTEIELMETRLAYNIQLMKSLVDLRNTAEVRVSQIEEMFANLTNGVAFDERFRGYTGELGGTGFTGSSGAIGVVGLMGRTGVTGYTGQNGATGVKGPIGYTGYTGYPGAKGPAGMQGQQTNGATGATGPTGQTGATGFTGFTGIRGQSGAAGAAGAAGQHK